MRKLRHQDYRVCWICPLDIERAAAEAMLDERHMSLPNNPHDTNVYTLGRIGKHNVAIAGLPIGNTMSVLLLVGIGGGAPSKSNDIRLGDIVVSYPDGNYGGVVQVDSGKSVPRNVHEDGFLIKGTLNQPPDRLLNVVKAVQAKHRGLPGSEQPDFIQFLRKSIKDRPRLSAERPGIHEDKLFDSMYDHVVDELTCAKCDDERVIRRQARLNDEPLIHVGLIASANNVRKDGRTRERLSQQLGVLCFEMEAGGAMNNFPCLTIRGISDYADSHKNDRWKPYAALAATAYAKEWLLAFPEADVSGLRPSMSLHQGE
ncbi:hypothetical protein D6C79_08111 [Aureobasidium pullulans]|nr:hypothetical protein D6C79_08111 [Aureobasidium pullulans]